MKLHSAQPYWLMKNGFLHEYPSLPKDLETDIVILGGGITGALIAWHLTAVGKQVILLDGRHIGIGSTCASTAMLQYEIDTPLYKLQDYVGLKNAERSYRLCIEAIDQLDALIRKLKIKADFERKPSLYYASKPADLPMLRKEFAARQKAGINVQWMDQKDIKKKFGFDKPAAIFSPDNSGQLDAYALTHGLLQAAMAKGLQVFDKTRIESISHQKGGLTLESIYGTKVKAKTLIMANGYEVTKYIPPGYIDLNSTYALVTEPYTQKNLWEQDSLIWETATPYLYMRTTKDRRILIGGKDEPFKDPQKRDQLIDHKTKLLVNAFEKLFPQLGPLRVDFAWAGTFAETPDGLPYIGQLPQHPNTWFALGFGGNGILFSQIAAIILRDRICKEPNADIKIFDFERIK
ncbi:MAG: FAD-dependent oxidoreductase [Saprospiraceae bacterium]